MADLETVVGFWCRLCGSTVRGNSLCLMALLIAGCSSPVGPEVVGVWGGLEVSLVLKRDGGQLQYACGNGTIESDWTVTRDGVFTAVGSHSFGGGPVSQDGGTPHPATYHGSLRQDELTLSVHLVDQDLTLGPFTLFRNGAAVQEICF